MAYENGNEARVQKVFSTITINNNDDKLNQLNNILFGLVIAEKC